MNSLFLRIFLWFWVAMVVMGVVLVVTSPFFTQSRSRVERWERGAEDWIRERVDRSAKLVAEIGVDEPQRGEHRGRGRPGHHVFVIDASGRDITGREASDNALDLAQRVFESGEEEAVRRGGVHLVAKPVSDPTGRRLVVVGSVSRPPRPIDLLEPRVLWWRLVLLALIVGALSFWLARYLSAPVDALRKTTYRLSEGDLSARVGGPVNRRRDEIGQLARDFDAMAERLEVVLGSQRRLLRDVSHELRSPLARLRVALELARDRAGSEATDPLDRIEHEASRVDELIGHILLLERLEAGESDTEAAHLDLASILSEVADDASFEASAAGREVILESGDACPVLGWPNLVRSALDNVLRNAIRHTPDDTAVEVSLERDGDRATVTVRDHGPGVPDEHLDSLFEPFTRVAEARDRSSGGAGLGLAITRRAVEMHGGTVFAANHPDGGLVVTIRLPKTEV
mgnify:FL=1